MRRISVLIIVLGLVSISSRSSQAQVRGVGAGSFVMDDYNGHTITLLAPTSVGPSLAEWNAWQAIPVANLNWFAAPPPVNNAQAGFILSGPLAGVVVPEFAYWLPPGAISKNGGGLTGGSAGTWDHATLAQLGAGAGAFTPAYMTIYNNGDYTMAINAPEAWAVFAGTGFTTPDAFTVRATNAGTYLVTYAVTTNTGASSIAIRVDGIVAQGTASGCATATVMISGSAILTLAAGANLQLINNNSAAAVDLKPLAGSTANGASMTALRVQ